MKVKFYIISISLMLCIQSGWAQPTFTGYVTNVTCHGSSDGIIDIEITGGVLPYDVKIDLEPWVHGIYSSSYSFTDQDAGSHTVYVLDANSILVVQTFIVTEPDEIMITGTIITSSCQPPGTGDVGCISLDVTGGVPDYEYQWNNGPISKNNCGLPCQQATYYVTVTDANGCTNVGSWVYHDIVYAATIINGGNLCQGEINLSVNCAAQPLYYWWEGPLGFTATTRNIIGLVPGIYCVAVTDINSFTKTCCWEVFGKSACATNYLQNLIVLPGEDNCYDAGQTIYVAGNGTTFAVENGGTATLIAGEKISFLPGTKVFPGGSMYGYITTTGQFCDKKSGVGNGNKEGIATDILPNPNFTGNQDFRVYPNPTMGSFILELNGDNNGSNIQADIYSMQGEKIVAAELKGEKKHEFSLAGYPPGLYFIRVVTGKEIGTGKIIKQ